MAHNEKNSSANNASSKSLDTKEPERVALVRHSLYNSFVQGRWVRLGVHQLINRSLLLFQNPLIVVFYRKTLNVKGEEVFKRQDFIKLHSIPDNVEGPAQKKLEPIRNSEEISLDYAELLYQLYKTEFYFMAFRNDRKHDSKEDNYYLLKKNENTGMKLLSKLFSDSLPFDGMINLTNTLDKQFNKLSKLNPQKDFDPKDIVCTLDSVEVEKFPEEIEAARKEIRHRIATIIDDVYDTASASPLLSHGQNRPCNIIFLTKTFTRKTKRYGNHDYDVSYIIPKKQRKQHERALKIISSLESKNTKTHWEFEVESAADGKDAKTEINKRYPINELDEYFWSTLSSKGGQKEILDSFNVRAADDSSVIADSSLETGLIDFSSSPFEQGGIIRMKNGEANLAKARQSDGSYKFNDDFLKNDFLRKVSAHYLFSTMARDSEDLRVLVVPIRVAGTTWGAMMTVDRCSKDASGNGRNMINSKAWCNFFHFYHDIASKVKNKIREQSKIIYISLAVEFISTLIAHEFSNEDKISLQGLSQRINNKLICLAQFLPYKQIKIEFRGSTSKIENNTISLFPTVARKKGTIHLAFHFLPNPFFENEVGFDFFSIENKRIIMNDVLKYVHQDVYFHTVRMQNKGTGKKERPYDT